ncbi:MAG: GNAT family N-acetyltransferase [Paracoccaceae bacterium]
MTKIAASPEEFRAAQRLRYDVFVQELGGAGPMVDHAVRLERDIYDPYCDHLLLYDLACQHGKTGEVVGVYRILTSENAKKIGGFYSEDEYDLGVLKAS